MADILRTTREDESRKRDEAALHQMQQQVDDLRRQLREAVARQQWLEDLYKNTEGQVVQLQMAQERHAQDVSQTLQVRQIEDGRLKQQLAELMQKAEEPMKPIRDLRAQIGELADARRQDRERNTADARQFETLQGQLRQLVSQIGLLADGQRQLRDLVHELDAVNNETRQEISRVAELQRMEEQRLRRQGVELQEVVEGLKVQFTELASRSARVEDVRRQLLEHIEALQAQATEGQENDGRLQQGLGRLEKMALENHSAMQDRTEAMRVQRATELSDVRQLGDQRMERYVTRFGQLEDRIRELDSRLAETMPHFEALYRRNEDVQALVDALEERHLRMEMENLETQMGEFRARRAKQQAEAAQKATLVRNVREARPHVGPPADSPDEES
jgi:chromosome segregation ATPase